MNFSRLYLLQTTFYIVLVIVACANRREVGQRLAEVNQSPQPETTSLQPIKFGLKNTTKQAKPEDILVSFNYTRSGNFPKNNTILPINQTTTTTTRPHGLAARSGADQQLVTQQLDISTTTTKNRRVNQKTTSIGHQQQQHLQLQSKQNQHQLEKQKQRSQHTSSEYKTKNPTQLNLQRKEIHHRQAIISTTTATTRTTSSAYLQQKLPTTQFPPPSSSSSSSSPFSSLLSTITPLRIKITTPPFGYVNNGNNHSIVIGNKRLKNYNNYKDKENLQLPNAIQPENVATSNVKAKKSSTVRHNSRSIVRKSSAHTNQPNQPTAFGSQFSLPLSFNIFSSEFWQFFIQPSSQSLQTAVAASTKKPPKKYKPTTSSSAFNSSALNRVAIKEEKLNYQKSKTVNSNGNKSITHPVKIQDTTTEIISKRNEASFRIAIPTLNRLHSNNQDIETNPDKDKRDAEVKLREKFNCPRENEVRFQLFPKICKIDEDCKVWNRDELCCEIFGAKSCVSGLPKPLEEAPHAPILGLIPRKCPSRPLAELWWEVQECETDTDCWPRICCPDGRKRYCRTSQPELDTVPESVQRSFNYLTDYLECTPPPPPIFDLHPKICTSTLDCFPNVCCQEAGLRHCRPPKKSVFTMLANVFNVEFVKRLTQNIVIK